MPFNGPYVKGLCVCVCICECRNMYVFLSTNIVNPIEQESRPLTINYGQMKASFILCTAEPVQQLSPPKSGLERGILGQSFQLPLQGKTTE